MHIAKVNLESLSPIRFSRDHGTDRLDKESPDEYEKRTWREKVHANKDGFVCIAPFMLKNSLSDIAKYLGQKIKGRGNNTYSKHFAAGILVVDPIVLPVHKDDVRGEWLSCSPQGKVGPGPRVKRCFPTVDEWKGVAEYHVLDDTITEQVFVEHLEQCGMYIGIGSFRPANRGICGRFRVNSVAWNKVGG